MEFDKVQQLVATQARTSLGRSLLTRNAELPEARTRTRLAQLTSAAQHLLDEDGLISFAGVDDALPWLEPAAPAPAEAGELLVLLSLARRISAVRRRLLASPNQLEVVRSELQSLPDTSGLIKSVAPRLGRDGTIPDDASPELRRLRRHTTRLRQDLLGRLDEIRRSHSDVVADAPPTMRRERYCLPLRTAARTRLPGLLLDTSSKGATSFVEPFAVVDLNNELADSSAREAEEIRRIVAEIAAEFIEVRDDMAAAAECLGRLDAAQARALFGRMIAGRVVYPGEGSDLILFGARHPLLDERLHSFRVEVFGETEQRNPDHHAVPLDFRLPVGAKTLVISGPNAGGKTVAMKTVGLMVLMASHGIPLPADEGTTIPCFDHLWCHIGDEQNVAADLSSFSGAMAATVELLRVAGGSSLVLYDELGAGTDPLEGAALGCALLEELTARSCFSIVTTHLAPIALHASSAGGMDNAAMGYDEARGNPTYSLTIGRPGRSRAVEIARRTGIPDSILDRASELLGGQHLELDRWLGRLERLEGELLQERAELEFRQRVLENLKDQADQELAALRADRDRVPRELADERDRLRRKAKLKLDNAIEKLDTAIMEHDRLGKRRRQKLRDEALDLGNTKASTPSSTAGLEAGQSVLITTLDAAGTLEELRGSRALVSSGGKRLWVAVDDLQPSGPPTGRPRRATVEISTEAEIQPELVLLGMDSERAREELVRFLDQAFTSGRPVVRVVHGHGTGVLRRTVAEVCRTHPAVRSFRHPPGFQGGTGATEVDIAN
jgi:DNA mismatch repair protein MutS2